MSAVSATAQRPSVLLLGGTSEGYELASALAARRQWHTINSLAGRTEQPRRPAGETRIGGFGGVAGLAAWLRAHAIRATLDATHPFAATMGWHAAAACAQAGVPLLRLERPPWTAVPGDNWHEVADWPAAVERLRHLNARRVLLAVGRQELAPFAQLDQAWFLIRCVTPPLPLPPFAAAEVRLARGPFTLADERALLDTYRIDAIVCKNSGGDATVAKLVAARERGLPVILQRRPPRPPTMTVTDIDAALAWLERVTKPAGE